MRRIVAACFAGVLAITSATFDSAPVIAFTPGEPGDPEFALRDAVAEQLSPLQESLAKQYPREFGGVWVAPDGTTTVATVGEASDLVAHVKKAGLLGPVTFKPVRHTEAEIRAARVSIRDYVDYRDFSIAGVRIRSIAEDIINNRVVIGVIGNAEQARSAVDESFGPLVTFESVDGPSEPVACTRSNCFPPLKAGVYLYNSADAVECVASFIFRSVSTPYTYYVSGAGHCLESGDAVPGHQMYHPVNNYVALAQFKSAGPSAGTDAFLAVIDPAEASNLKLITGGYSSITSRETISGAVLGSGVCSYKPSGWDCGTLASKGIDTCCSRDQFAAASMTFSGGDSGSPVFYGAKAQGIASAQNCNPNGTPRWDCYSPIQSVEIWKSSVRVLLTAP